MKFVDKIMNSLNIFDEEEITEEELLAEEKAEAEKKEKRSLFAKKTPQTTAPAAPDSACISCTFTVVPKMFFLPAADHWST